MLAGNPGLLDTSFRLREPAEVMRLARMGAAFPTRLSFMRSLLRRSARQRWSYSRTRFELDDQGYGIAAWKIALPSGPLTFLAFTNPLSDADRTDRVIAEKWDASFVLHDGEADDSTVDRLHRNAPLQEAGRYSPADLVLSRANKSVRLFELVVASLAHGVQPSREEILKVGYLMRTTAVYGNGKFGLGDFPRAARHPELDGPYRAELLTVYLIRHFQLALADHIAVRRGGNAAAKLAPELRRALGIGNATGLGMAPFLVRHPILIHRWIAARETALARVLAEPRADDAKRARYAALLSRARRHCEEWHAEEPKQERRLETLRAELSWLAGVALGFDRPWHTLFTRTAETCGLDTQELLGALLIELYPEKVDDLEDEMSCREAERIDGRRTVGELRNAIETIYGWALRCDLSAPEERALFWYYSEAKEEPRLGRRFEEPGADREMRLGMGHYIRELHAALATEDAGETVAAFLLRRPQWRLAARRVDTALRYPYSEIHDNLLGQSLLPIDLLRCKLAFFGATKFDPRSDLWTRITMYQGAPLLEELGLGGEDDWWLPAFTA